MDIPIQLLYFVEVTASCVALQNQGCSNHRQQCVCSAITMVIGLKTQVNAGETVRLYWHQPVLSVAEGRLTTAVKIRKHCWQIICHNKHAHNRCQLLSSRSPPTFAYTALLNRNI